MKSVLPWQIKGVRRQARETARTAARRAGMSVGEWLDTVILNSAESDHEADAAGADEHDLHRDDEHDEQRMHRSDDDESVVHRSFNALNERIDSLARQLSQVARLTSERGKVNEPRDDEALRQLASLVGKLDRRLDQAIAESRSAKNSMEQRVETVGRAVSDLKREHPRGDAGAAPATSLDRALLEIADRQRALDGNSSRPAATGSTANGSSSEGLPRARTQELSGLEQQLRDINRQIENIGRPCGVDKAIDGLRDDLTQIGAMLQEAMPRKSVEALEEAMRKLSERVEAGRDAGVHAPALAGVERGLAELRETVGGMGAGDNLGRLDRALQELSRKIEGIAQNSNQPTALKGIETALATMRSTVSHVASNDALASLSDEVRALAGKLDRATSPASGDNLANLEQRIAALADALQARNNGGQSAPSELESVIKGLAEKIERVQLTRADPAAMGHLEERIAKLVEKLDASDARLNQLEAIERGLAELLIHLEHQRLPTLANTGSGASAPSVLSRDLAELQQTEKKTRESLEMVHGTLGHVVDRLAMIETDMRGNSRPRLGGSKPIPARTESRAASQPSRSPPPSARVSDKELPGSEPPSAGADTAGKRPQVIADDSHFAAEAVAAPEQPAIEGTLPPDHPLEPRTAREGKPDSPAERIAASQSALDQVKAAVPPEPEVKSDFIAAARRAAQAAARQASSKSPSTRATEIASAAGKLANRVGKLRALIAGSSIILLVLGSLELARTLLGTGPETETSASVAQTAVNQTKPEPAPQTRIPEVIAAIPSRTREACSAERIAAAAATSPAGTEGASRPASMVNLPLEIARQVAAGQQPSAGESGSEVTGSLPAAASATPSLMPSSPLPAVPTKPPGAAPEHSAENLPGAFGPNLRAAAVRGEAAAQFEIAVRFAEGRAVPQNFSSAAEWFERAAKKGLTPAQFRLAGLYEKGLGVKKNLDTARRYYATAGEAGHAEALHNLAVLYAEGIDGKPDYQTAAKWFRKAAGYGVVDSQYNLAVLYARGIGVEQNLAEAYKWFVLAAREGDPESARKRDDLASRLDRNSLQAAMQAAQAFAPEQQPEAAVHVNAPPGGWDQAAVSPAPPGKRKPLVVGPKLDLATPVRAQ
ncbi:MAG: hypothetical protein ABWZ64_15175 [Xanthobacteraceae bacterium]